MIAKAEEPLLGIADEVPKPGLFRIAISASVYLFLCYLSFAMSFTPMVELFMHQLCAQNGLIDAHCQAEIGGVVNTRYAMVQKEAASSLAIASLATGLPPVITCAFFGCLSDAYGRRISLIIPVLAGVMQGLVWPVAPSINMGVFICTLFSFGGGNYVYNMAAFSTLADVTQHSTPAERANVFGIVEAALWVGLFIGPVLGGEMIRLFGSQYALFAAAAVGLLNATITALTYPETLGNDQRHAFCWRRTNPFVSVFLFFQTRVTTLLGMILFCSLIGQAGGVSFLSLYALKVANLTPTMLGLLQSTVLGSSVFGLVVAMPLLVRCISLQKLVVLSSLDGVIGWMLMAMVVLKWQLYAVSVGLFLAGCFFPVVRTGMANTFGKKRYGESLAAVGVMEQLAQMVGPPLAYGMYQATVDVEVAVGSLKVHSIASASVACVYLISMIAALFTSHIPYEAESDDFSLQTLDPH